VAQTSGARRGDSEPADPQLAEFVAAWPNLPAEVRDRLLGIVRSAGI
jgi:hypothetical protein